MLPIEFGNGKGLQITNTLLTTEIINKVETTYNLDINYRHYHFLDKNRALELRQKEHSFSSSNGPTNSSSSSLILL